MTNREEALAASSADWVIDGFEAELAAYRSIIQKMRDDLAALEPEQRKAVEEASAILRKARAAATVAPERREASGAGFSARRVSLPLAPIGTRPYTPRGVH